jgi:hypothetical protein
MINITKLIPFNIRIKSLYWVKKEREIDSDLSNLFSKIDNDEYEQGRISLNELRDKWTEFSHTAPEWFQLEYIPQFSKAEAMLNFLQTPSED